MLQAYRTHVAERAALGIPPLPLSAGQTAELIELLKNPQPMATLGEEAVLVELITHRVPAGVDDAAKVKASYLAALAHGSEKCVLISREKATELLGTMLGGYNIGPLTDLLDDDAVAAVAANGLKKTLLMFDHFHDVKDKADKGTRYAKEVLQSGADGEWFCQGSRQYPVLCSRLTRKRLRLRVEFGVADLVRRPGRVRRAFLAAASERHGHGQRHEQKNPRHPYILQWDVPKLAAFRAGFPGLAR